jgi:hypothetical protein
MPRMLAQEHLGYVDAIQYGGAGLARNAATVAAALTAIGAKQVILILSFTGDGVWTLNTALVFPVNVTVSIPPGVVLNGSGNLTFNGAVRAENSAFYAGTGTLTFAPTAPYAFFNQISARGIGLNAALPIQAQLHLSGDATLPAVVLVQQRVAGAGNAGIVFRSANSDKGFLGVVDGTTSQNLVLDIRGTGGSLIMGGPGGAKLGLNLTTDAAPQGQIHILGNAALPAVLRLEEITPAAGGAVHSWWSAGTKRGELGIVSGTQDITLQLSNSARFIVNGGNVGIGGAPTRTLQLFTDQAAKTATTTWEVISDGRVKEEIEDFTVGLDLVLQVRPVRFAHNGKGGIPASTDMHISIIGQELQEIAPYMVGSHRAKLHEDDTDETDLLTFKGGGDMIFVLINAVKTLHARLTALEEHA